MADANNEEWKKTVEGVIGHVQLFIDADPTKSFTSAFVSQMLKCFRDAHNSEVAELKRQREEALTIVNEVEKCANMRGISSALMYGVVLEWCQVLEDGLENWNEDNYSPYGYPLFKAVDEKYGWGLVGEPPEEDDMEV